MGAAPVTPAPRNTPPSRPSGVGSIKVVERAGRVFDVLKQRDTATVADLVSVLGENRTTIVRLCEVLTSLGLLERASERSMAAYRLGPEVFYLGSLYRQRSRLRITAMATLQRMVEATEDSAFLIIPSQRTAICMVRVDGKHWVTSVLLEEGAPVPYDRGGGSQAILAFLPAAERDAALDALGPERAAAVRPRLQEIRPRGYALSLNELVVATGAIGAPVFGENATLLGAVSVGGNISRFAEDRHPLLTGVVLQAGQEVSRAMGYLGPYPPPYTDD
jgi:DNA-binding IclR family transcriptional regulator